MIQMQGITSATPPRLCSFLCIRAPMATSPLFPGMVHLGHSFHSHCHHYSVKRLHAVPNIQICSRRLCPCTLPRALPALSPAHIPDTCPFHRPQMLWVHPLCPLAKASKRARAVHESTAHHMLRTLVPTFTAGSYVPGAGHKPTALQTCTSDVHPSAALPHHALHVHASTAPHMRAACPASSHCPRHSRCSAQLQYHMYTLQPYAHMQYPPTCCRCCACMHCYLTHMATCL